MKTLLKISLLALGLGTMAFPAVRAAAADDATAPAAKHPRLRALLKHRAMVRARVARELNLTSEQIAQLKADRAKTRDAVKAIRADTSLTPKQKRAKARETLLAARNEMRGVLSAEQLAKLDVLRQQHRAGKLRRG